MLADPLVLIAISVACGLFIGVFSGLLGIGGGTLMIPVFRLLFGMSPTMCTATSLFAIIPTSISGTTQHVRNKTCLLPVALAAGLGGALTSPAGVWLAQRSPGWAVMLAASLIIGYTAFTMLRKALRMPKQREVSQLCGQSHKQTHNQAHHQDCTSVSSQAPNHVHNHAPNQTYNQENTFTPSTVVTRKQLFITALIGMAAGVASGFAGVGGGFLMVPLFLSFLGLSMKQASGTSLAAVMVLATPGVITQMLLGNVNYFAGIAIVCGTIPGALIGAQLANRVPDRTLRLVFGVFLLFGALILVLNEFATA